MSFSTRHSRKSLEFFQESQGFPGIPGFADCFSSLLLQGMSSYFLPHIPGKASWFELEMVKMFTGLTITGQCNQAFHGTFYQVFLVKPMPVTSSVNYQPGFPS